MITTESSVARPRPRSSSLGRYELLGVLGEGGHGIVYEARDVRSHAQVAVKVLHDVRPAALFRIKREFRQLARLSHPNVVSLFELDAAGGQVYFAMELVRGRELAEWLCGPPLESGVYPPCRDRARLEAALAQLAGAVDAIHAAGLLHRDLKPSNVLVTDDGRVVLLDFGIAVPRREAQRTAGRFAGTPRYASPEQVAGRPIDTPSDWYAVGAMLHEWLAGSGEAGDPLAALAVRLLRADPMERATGADVRAALTVPPPASEVGELRGFVGRAPELESLATALAASRRGPVVRVVRGSSGIGKTALVERFLAAAPDETIRLIGACSELESLPYRAIDPVIDALALHRRASAETADALPALGRLFPALAAGDPDEPAGDPIDLRRRAFDEARDVLCRLAEVHPTIIALDDAQHLDLDSAALLAAVLAATEPPALLLVLVLRDDVAEPPAVAGLLAELGAHGLDAGNLAVEALSAGDAIALAADWCAGDQAFAAAIAREAAGSPLLVRELARHALRDAPKIEAPTIDAMIRSRFEGLAAADREVVQLVATAGGRLARGVIGEPAAVGFRRLCAAGWIHLVGSWRASELEIAHTRIGEGVRGLSTGAERVALHHRLAGKLVAASAPASQIADHFTRGDDPAGALPYTLRAADDAEASFAFAHTVEWYRRALANPCLPAPRRPELEAKLGRALATAGQPVAGAAAYLRAATLDGETPASIEARCLAAEHLLYSGHVVEGREVLDAALRVLGETMPRRTPAAILAYAIAKLRMPDLERPPPAATAPAPWLRARLAACWSAARGLMIADLGIHGAVFQARYVRLAAASGDPDHLARALAHEAAVVATVRADRAAALQLLDRARACADRATSPFAHAFADQCEGAVHYCFGEYAAAFDAYDRSAVAMATRCRDAGTERILSALNAAIVLEHRGRLRQLAPRCRSLLAEAIEHQIPYVEGFARGMAAVSLALAADRIDDARAELARFREGPVTRSSILAAQYAGAESSLCWYEGDGAAGYALAQQRWHAIRRSNLLRVPWARDRIRYWRIANAIAAASGTAARERLRFAAAEARRLGRSTLPLGRAFGLAATAAIQLASHATEAAIAPLRDALATFAALDLAAHAAAIRRRLAPLVGGSEGAELQRASDAYWRDEGIAVPARFAAMVLPGL